MNIKCFLLGHKSEFRFYRDSVPIMSPIEFEYVGWLVLPKESYPIGFAHSGICSKCERCGHIREDSDERKPILEPMANYEKTESPSAETEPFDFSLSEQIERNRDAIEAQRRAALAFVRAKH